MIESLNIFAGIPRLNLAPLDTPIQELEFLHDRFPRGPRVYIKRDDFIGPMVWGNKLRKLEYTLAEARSRGADTLITTGGIQSNHARTTAQVARQEGFDVVLVLNGSQPEEAAGNYLINHLLQVEVHFVENRLDRIPKMREIAQELRNHGKQPYIIPLGASDEFGTLGFMKAAEELKRQENDLGLEFDAIIHASSSGGTQAGLILGKKLFNLKARVIGISADSTYDELSKSIHLAADPIIHRLKAPIRIGEEDIHVDTGYIGPGYGIPSPLSIDTAKYFGKKAGILLDHTYSGKAMAGLIDYLERNTFQPEQNILFWHTGGTVALFNFSSFT